MTADLIIHNALVRTMEHASPQEAESGPVPTAVAVSGDRISAAGSDAEILALAGPGTRVIDAGGAALVPGLIDSHMHPIWGIELTRGVDLYGLDFEGVRSALAREAERLPEGAWVCAWNLDHNIFDSPMRGDAFDDVLGGRPLAVVLYDLHTGLGNPAALAAAGITGAETFDDASLVVLDEEGVPTGELREIPAYLLLLDAVPPIPQEEYIARLHALFSTLNGVGITSAVVMDGRDKHLDLLAEMEEGGDLSVQLHIAMWHQPGDGDDRVAQIISQLGRSGRGYRVQLIKMFLDGVIESGTAWLNEPDTCGTGTHSFWKDLDRYEEVTGRYIEAGYQIATHSVGDAGVGQILEAYKRVGTASPAGAPNRIEHLEVLTDPDISNLAETGVVASMQPLHMQWRAGDGSDAWASRLGPHRSRHGAFRVKDVLAAGGRVTLGSDWPVAQYDPRLGMAWARLRRTPGCPAAPVFEPEQRLTGYEALLGYTRWAAEALGRDDLGVIRSGAKANLVLFAGDPAGTDGDALPELPVLLTVVDGKPVHSALA
ncbi:MAG: amidohydrolase [Arthrobacter sp.]